MAFGQVTSHLQHLKMPRKRHTPEKIVAKLRQIEVAMSQGKPVAGAVRSHGVTGATYYRWRQEFGGRKDDICAG
jgi:putative transposase